MKKLIFNPTHTLLAAALLLATACTSDLTDRPEGEPLAISFGNPQTRAAVDNAQDLGDFSVWGWYNPDFLLFDATTVSAPSWTYDGGTRYWVPGQTYQFHAVHPTEKELETTPGLHVEFNSKNGTFIVENFDCSKTGANAVDLMFASKTDITYTAGEEPQPVSLKFGHELAKVNVIVKSTGTKVTVNGVKVYGVNYKGSLNQTPDGDSWQDVTDCTADDTPYQTSASKELNTTAGLEYNPFGDLLLIPDSDLTNAKLEIAYQYPGDTADRTATVDLNTTATTAWDAGKSYKYTATLSGGTVNISVTIKDWTEEDTSVDWKPGKN